jgi:TatA/E family protein of Tat protein translocase
MFARPEPPRFTFGVFLDDNGQVIAALTSETGLIILAVVLLLLFGSAKLPQFARSLGEAKKELQEGMKDGEKKSDEKSDDEAPKA